MTPAEAGRAALAALPDSVRVGPYDFVFEIQDRLVDRFGQHSGAFVSTRFAVEISRAEARTPQYLVDTVLHELGHAVWWVAGLTPADGEERIVGTESTTWTQLYRDNPWLLAWLATWVAWRPAAAT